MIVRKKDMRTQVRTNMKGGTGEVTVLHLVDPENLANVRFVGEMTIPPGAGIGEHGHEQETEYYLIAEGIAVASDNGKEEKVGKGEVIITGGGATHSLRNGGTTPLKVIAFIVTH